MLVPLFTFCLVAVLYLLATNRAKLSFRKNPSLIVLTGISAAWWLFLVIDQLRTKLDCAPNDGMCMSGNTFWGDVMWGSFLAIGSLVIIWLPALLIILTLQKSKDSKTKDKT